MGWGLSLTNAGTYTSQTPRKIVVPLLPQDELVRRVVRGVIQRRRRARAARIAVEHLRSDETARAVREAEGRAEEAHAELERARARLAELVRERDGRVREIDREFEAELGGRLRKVEREYEGKIRDVMGREIDVEEVTAEDVEREMGIGDDEEKEKEEKVKVKGKDEGEAMEVDGEKKEGDGAGKEGEEESAAAGKDDSAEDGPTGEPKAKRPKTDGDASGKIGGDAGGGEEEEEDGEIADEKEEKKLESERKDEELTKAKSDLDGLNQTKSQMVWLLKQVITAENKRKMEFKKMEGKKGKGGEEAGK